MLALFEMIQANFQFRPEQQNAPQKNTNSSPVPNVSVTLDSHDASFHLALLANEHE